MSKPVVSCPVTNRDFACKGTVCGHCQKCREPLDNHKGLGTSQTICPSPGAVA